MVLTPAEHVRLDRWADDPAGMVAEARAVEAERIVWRRVWGAAMLTSDANMWCSICAGRSVLAGKLDGVVLRRALRGAPPPPAEDFVQVTPEMLDSVAETGPLQQRRRR